MRTRPTIQLTCKYCHKSFEKPDHHYKSEFKRNPNWNPCCSGTCRSVLEGRRIEVKCLECSKQFLKMRSEFKKAPNHFCSKTCAATFNNKNKTHGNRRSKLELWIEIEVQKIFPKLEFHFNRKDAINSELDVYIPSLKLAFELNGIFHYEPIYGKDKLNQIKNNDNRKFQACIENGIELCIIDTSQHKYVKPSTSQKYLNIITKLVNNKLSKTDCVYY